MMKADDSQALKRQLLRIEAEKGIVAKPKRDDVSWPRWSRFVVFWQAVNGKTREPGKEQTHHENKVNQCGLGE